MSICAIIGLGSQAELVYSILKSDYTYTSIVFLSYNFTGDISKFIYKDLYKGDIGKYVSIEDTVYVIAVGDNYLRKTIAETYPLRYTNVISKRAYVCDGVSLGTGNVICPGAIVQVGCTIGDHCIVNTNSSIDHHCIIGSYVHTAPQCAICGHVTIFEGAFLGVGTDVVPNVKIRPWSFNKAHSLIKESTGPIPMYDIYTTNSFKSAHDAIDSTWISSQGKYIKMAETRLRDMLGVPYVILLNNGTCATHCLWMAVKHVYPHISKVYCPNNVYVAAVNSILYEFNLSQIELLRIDKDTWNLDTSEEYIKSLDAGSAVLIVHNLGNIVDVDRLKRLRPDLIFVEDNCEGLFGKYPNGEYSGTSKSSLCSSISFFANKTITSGEGGAFMTHDEELYRFMSKTINQGNSEIRYIHDTLGYNYRITNLQAAILWDQLNDSEEIIKKKKEIFERFRNGIPKRNQQTLSSEYPSNWIFGVTVKGKDYTQAVEYFTARGIDIRPFFYPMWRHKHLEILTSDDTQVSEALNRESFMIPSYPGLKDSEVLYIIDSVCKYIRM